MTCKEFHDCQANDQRTALVRVDSAEVSEHFANCPECRGFAEEHRELSEFLHALRGSVPTVPANVDRSVIMGYRRFMAERAPSGIRTRRITLHGALGWAAALIFAVVVAYGALPLFVPHQQSWFDRQSITIKPAPAARRESTAIKESPQAQNSASQRSTSTASSVRAAAHRAAATQEAASLPTGFQSLMYCDQISCAGEMDIIRVRLPSPMLGFTAAAQPNGVFTADVIVGPDGIARGIRVVE